MENKESLTVKMMKRMYDVSGVLDEYRKSRIDEVGNQAFIIFYMYTPLSLLLATLFIDSYPREALIALLGTNFLLFMIITGYIFIKTADLRLQDIEVEKKNYQAQKKRLIKKSLRNGLYTAIMIYVVTPLISVAISGESYKDLLTSWSHIKTSLLGGIFICLLLLGTNLLQLKKIEE